MRANIPRTSPRPPVDELGGIYLQAMKEVSSRLMENLPAGEDLWRTLGQVEAMLLEAQLRDMPLTELFGSGGVAAFCQSIVDEYRKDGDMIIPAALDRSVKPDRKHKEPRGGVNYKRYRRTSAALLIVLSLLLAALVLWYTGVLRFWTGGTSYYLEELHNFQSTATETLSGPITVTLPLEQVTGLSNVLYSDGEGYDITLTSVEIYDRVGSHTDPDTGETVYQKMTSWYLRMTYTVESSFTHVEYVEPSSNGTVTVTLRDGTVRSGKITWIESGEAGRGREYARISVIDLPANVDTEGATLTVTMDPPYRIEWTRVSTGKR